jgi:hypothetical protein
LRENTVLLLAVKGLWAKTSSLMPFFLYGTKDFTGIKVFMDDGKTQKCNDSKLMVLQIRFVQFCVTKRSKSPLNFLKARMNYEFDYEKALIPCN